MIWIVEITGLQLTLGDQVGENKVTSESKWDKQNQNLKQAEQQEKLTSLYDCFLIIFEIAYNDKYFIYKNVKLKNKLFN